MSKEVYTVILAGGRSIRMKMSKMTLQWRGKSIFEHVICTASTASANPVYVVLRKNDTNCRKTARRYNARIQYNETPGLGMSSSIKLAIRSLPKNAKAVVMLLGDQPGVHFQDIDGVIKSFEKLYNETEPLIIQTKYGCGTLGHPVLFSHHFFNDLLSLEGDIGGREIIAVSASSVFYYCSSMSYPMDIDTPEDYRKLISLEKSEESNL